MTRRLFLDDGLVVMALVRWKIPCLLSYSMLFLTTRSIDHICVTMCRGFCGGLQWPRGGSKNPRSRTRHPLPQGRFRTEELSTPDVEAENTYEQAEYASYPLLHITHVLIKWSISSFVEYLSPTFRHYAANTALRILLASIAIVSVIVSLFRCSLPCPWDYIQNTQCIDWVSQAARIPTTRSALTKSVYREPGGQQAVCYLL